MDCKRVFSFKKGHCVLVPVRKIVTDVYYFLSGRKVCEQLQCVAIR